MNSFFSDIELKIGTVLAEHPERSDAPGELFKEASGVDLGNKTKVCLHQCDDQHFNFILPPHPNTVKALLQQKNPLGSYFRSMFVDPNTLDENTEISIQQGIAIQALSSESTLKEIKENPKKFFEKITGGEKKSGLHVEVYQNSADTIHINIPPSSLCETELNEFDLDNVVGGVAVVPNKSLYDSDAEYINAVSRANKGGLDAAGVLLEEGIRKIFK